MEESMQSSTTQRLLVQGAELRPDQEQRLCQVSESDETQKAGMGLPDRIAGQVQEIVTWLKAMPEVGRIDALNTIRQELHQVSPFIKEPVDYVLWIPADKVEANNYNPNKVAPPEMKLLQHSIREDGYTQPIVGFDEGKYIEVVDGFHRNRVGKECKDIRERLHGYLPITLINADRSGRTDRIAATIRHNRARGKHAVTGMSDIVLELSRRNWSDAKIGRELGMEPDEVLRLKQITGLAELFADKEFSEAWEGEPDGGERESSTRAK